MKREIRTAIIEESMKLAQYLREEKWDYEPTCFPTDVTGIGRTKQKPQTLTTKNSRLSRV